MLHCDTSLDDLNLQWTWQRKVKRIPLYSFSRKVLHWPEWILLCCCDLFIWWRSCKFCSAWLIHSGYNCDTYLLAYASWFLVEQRAATTPLQRTQLWLALFSLAHVVPAAFISASVLLRQVCFRRPTLRFPCRFQSRACLVMLDAGFRSVWPIQPW